MGHVAQAERTVPQKSGNWSLAKFGALGNAATAGALSNIRDLYQRRIASLAPCAAVLLVTRRRTRELTVSRTTASF